MQSVATTRTLIDELETTAGAEDFLAGVEVWIRRPHVVNRRLMGAIFLEEGVVEQGKEEEWLLELQKPDQKRRKGGYEGCKGTEPTPECDEGVGSAHAGSCQVKWLVRELLPRVRGTPPTKEVVLSDPILNKVTFQPLMSTISDSTLLPYQSYELQYHPASPSRISLTVCLHKSPSGPQHPSSGGYSASGITAPTVAWLQSVLLPKIAQWAEESATKGSQDLREPLVPLDRYCKLYQDLKEKYGPSLIKIWPEATDPHKFVYEDIAIATYLLILWEEERKALGQEQRQSFVDLGCGNGLLVYLLSSEGHPGKGIDLRERKIWRLLATKARLEVRTLTPSDTALFPESDWLIGNHSDELTPWIPVIAARSSYNTRYFVLPCCPHDFDRKFCRPDTLKSQYRSYLDYVTLIGETMGFVVEEDTLRIPSSKRICQVGRKRAYPSKDEVLLDERRQQFLDERCSRKVSPPENSKASKQKSTRHFEAGKEQDCATETFAEITSDVTSVQKLENAASPTQQVEGGSISSQPSSQSESVWAAEFRPRTAKEQVRNCSLVARSTKEHIVQTLTSLLLQSENWVEVEVGDSPQAGRDNIVSCDGGDDSCVRPDAVTQKRLWNRGGRIYLSDAVKLFDASVLRQLKQEYGGLQTLLRNHHQIFQVSAGYVELRNWGQREQTYCKPPKPRSQKDAKQLVKTKLCWFHMHHPQGCPKLPRDCPYAHEPGELRARPDFKDLGDAAIKI